MAHELDFSNGRAAFAHAAEVVPWHGYTNPMADGATIDEWIAASGLDYKIQRAKVRYPATAADANNPAAWRVMDDRHVLLRSDNGNPLGIVSAEYSITQPRQILEFFRDLCEDMGYRMISAGALFGGARYWAQAEIASDSLTGKPGSEVKMNLMCASSADGTLANVAKECITVIVCNNTLTAARGERAGKEAKMRHRKAFDENELKIRLGLRSADEAKNSFFNQMEFFRGLTRRRMTPLDMTAATLELFGFDPSNMDDAAIKSAKRKRALVDIGERASTGQFLGAEDHAGTAWGWLNTVTEYVDHHAKADSAENRANTAIWGKGDAMKSRALEIVTAFAGGPAASTVIYDASADDAPGGILGDVLAATAQGN